MSPPAEPALCLAVVCRTRGEAASVLADFSASLAAMDTALAGACLVRDCAEVASADALRHALASMRPQLVALAGTDAELRAIAPTLGRPFDATLRADDPATGDRLRAYVADYGEWTQVGLWGGAAGTLEMTLGAALHALRVPLRGAALCSAQAATLTLASARLRPAGRVAWVAFVAAGLKAFSPGGGRARPMLAITVQGVAFGAIVQLLGWNAVSVTLGGAAIGTWAALQGFFVQYLLLGDDLAGAYRKAATWLAEAWAFQAPSLPVVLGTWAALHASLAATAAWTAWKFRALPRPLRSFAPESATPSGQSPKTTTPSAAPWPRRLAREFGRWHFWLPLVLVAAVLLAAGRGWEHIAWLVARFVAVGAVLFAALSLFQPAALARRMRRYGWWGPAAALTEAFARRRTR